VATDLQHLPRNGGEDPDDLLRPCTQSRVHLIDCCDNAITEGHERGNDAVNFSFQLGEVLPEDNKLLNNDIGPSLNSRGIFDQPVGKAHKVWQQVCGNACCQSANCACQPGKVVVECLGLGTHLCCE